MISAGDTFGSVAGFYGATKYIAWRMGKRLSWAPWKWPEDCRYNSAMTQLDRNLKREGQAAKWKQRTGKNREERGPLTRVAQFILRHMPIWRRSVVR